MSTDNQNDLWGAEPSEDMFGEETQPGPDLFGDVAPPPDAAADLTGGAMTAPGEVDIPAPVAPVSSAKAQSDGYVVLARKYRPQTFDDLVGQDGVQQALRGAIATGQISHSYLFSGPRGTGKTSTARILAKAVNCQEGGPRADPCGRCSSCRSITVGSSLDVIEIDAASNTGVDNIRDLKSGVVLAPFSRFKVYIVDEVHMLSNQAFNALLKTLEEPPPQVIFVLATTELHKVPETIISRCQTFMFKRFSLAELKGQLGHILDIETQARGIEVAAADRELILDLISRSAEGGMRDAQVTLDQVLVLSKGRLDFDSVRRFLGIADNEALDRFIQGLYDKEARGLLELIEELVAQGQDLELFVKSAADHMRDLLLVRTAGRDTSLINVSEDRAQELEALANGLSPAFLVNAIEQFIKLAGEMKVSGQPRMVLELAVLKLTTVAGPADLDAILRRLEALEARFAGGESSGGPGNAAAGAQAAGGAQSRAQGDAPAGVAPTRPVSRSMDMPLPTTPKSARPVEVSSDDTSVAPLESVSSGEATSVPPGDAEGMIRALTARLSAEYEMFYLSFQKVFCGQSLEGRTLSLFVSDKPKMPSAQVQKSSILADVARELFGDRVTVKVVVREDGTALAMDSRPAGNDNAAAPAARSAGSAEKLTNTGAASMPSEPATTDQVSAEALDEKPVIYYPEEIREKAMRELKPDEFAALLSSDAKMKELVDKAKAVFGIDEKSLRFLRSTLA